MEKKLEINIFEHPAIVYWRAIMISDLEAAGTIDSGLDQIEGMELQKNFDRLLALSDELLFLDRHIRGHSKKGLEPFIKDLLKEGVTIPLELMQRIYMPRKNAGACKDPAGEMIKQKIAGRLRALADVKGRGAVEPCYEAIRHLALESQGEGNCRKEVDVLLKSGTAKNMRYMDKMTLQKCFTRAEIKEISSSFAGWAGKSLWSGNVRSIKIMILLIT